MTVLENRTNAADWFDLLNGLVRDGAAVELPVLSGSMAPVIMPGKKIKIRALPGKNARAGDIIVFKEGNSLTAHRLLVRLPLGGNPLLFQKGDANRFGNWMRASRVVGIVEAVQDESGLYSAALNSTGARDAKAEALRQLARVFVNAALLLPGIIKRWIRKN
jgi:signal peptidase I